MAKTEVFTLLFTEEDYENAKELLCQSYENASVILHAQGQRILKRLIGCLAAD